MAGEMPPIIEELRQKLEIVQEPMARVDLLNTLAIELRDSDARQGLETAGQARSLADSIGYVSGLAYSLRNMAECLRNLGEYSQALKLAGESLDLFEKLGDESGRYRALNTLGVTYYQINDRSRALEHDIKMLECVRKLGDVLAEASALNNIGLTYMDIGDNERAVNYFQESLEKYEACGRDDYVSKPLMNLGIIYLRRRDLSQSLDYFQRSLEACQKHSDVHGQAQVWYNLAMAHKEMKDIDAALSALERCQELSRRSGSRRLELDSIIERCRLLVHRSGADEGLRTVKEIEEVVNNFPDDRLQAKILLARSELHETRREFDQALAYHKRYASLMTEIHDREELQILRGLDISFEVEQMRRQSESIKQRNAELEQLHRLIRKGEEFRGRLMEQLAAQARQLEKLATHDELTGLYNRRFLNERLANEFNRAGRYHQPLAVAMIDIDHFKRINDNLTHRAGDQVLKEVARIISANCREVDIAARYGGEEFVLVFPNTDGAQALTVCERIRQAVEEHCWQELDSNLSVTVSIGIIDNADVADGERMLVEADKKMYRAKEMGRNKIVASGDK